MLVEKIKDFDADHDLLTHLLEMKNDSGKTAILISCQNKDYALVEFLVEAGADLRAVDQDGNSAIILAASSTAVDETLSKVLSPTICRVRYLLILQSTIFSPHHVQKLYDPISVADCILNDQGMFVGDNQQGW